MNADPKAAANADLAYLREMAEAGAKAPCWADASWPGGAD